MASLHRVFRNALSATPQLVGSAVADDDARAEMVASYYDNVLRLLHSHHEGEDELMTPKLVERCPDQAADVQRIADQHHAVLSAIGDAEARLADWRADSSAANRDAAAGALTALDGILAPHLDEEERVIVPLAATCINVAEWGQLPEHGLKTFSGDKIWLVLGLIREQMTPAMIANMDAHMPPPVFDFWQNQGQALFDGYASQLRA